MHPKRVEATDCTLRMKSRISTHLGSPPLSDNFVCEVINVSTDMLETKTWAECGIPLEEVIVGNSFAFLCSMRPLVISNALSEEGTVVEEGAV